MSKPTHDWWANLRHGGMLLDQQRLGELVQDIPGQLTGWQQDKLRRKLAAFQESPNDERSGFVRFILHRVCGFSMEQGEWSAGTSIGSSWSRRALTGEGNKPDHMWVDHESGSVLPVFIDKEKRLGLGKSRRAYSKVLQWLRKGDEQLAILTNGYQWRIVFAGLDYDAYCEWDIDQWFFEGQPSLELAGLVSLVSPKLWAVPEKGKSCQLLNAVNDSRKGQADLSQVLGERVRQAVEHLIQAHSPLLNDHYQDIKPQDIYRAAVRMIMRLVVILFAESREGLLPTDQKVYFTSYSLGQLQTNLSRASDFRKIRGYAAWPRLLALMRLIYKGSPHPELNVKNYGGELFAPGKADSNDGVLRVLHLFETGCFQKEIVNDHKISEILDLLTRTKIRIRQGRSSTMVPSPVDFSSLDSEYIGILYEGLLDFELRCVGKNEPVVFLAVGNHPALPLTTLEAMDEKAIRNLLESMKDKATKDDGEPEEDAEEEAATDGGEAQIEEEPEEGTTEEEMEQDERFTLRQRAERWARQACISGGLVRKPRGKKHNQQLKYESELEAKARSLITTVVLPGEWYLVRWGGTRKGSGTFYTRPQLATPTVHRTLRPLAYDPPMGEDGKPDTRAPAEQWTPKLPEEILKLKVCDPACGSGSFCLASMRFLTNALYESLVVHERIKDYADYSLLQLIAGNGGTTNEGSERVDCRPDDDSFEDRTKAKLRRYVVERCIYGVDLDPLAIELCRLSLWIETLDRHLPLTFLNHKIKCGNSLVGAWFDQFAHYPIMAWEREGGDTNHSNGVHFKAKQFTNEIKAIKKEAREELKKYVEGAELFDPVDLATVNASHGHALQTISEIHELSILATEERSLRYQELINDKGYKQLKAALDLWCTLWFWPLEKLHLAPHPLSFAKGDLPASAWEAVHETVTARRFFHWELEFPDVFNPDSSGFDATVGNPPWDISKPNSKEFYSSHDPMYRSYGKQEAIAKQKEMFERDIAVEDQWLDYSAYFKAMSNWMKFAGFPFGNRLTTDSNGKQKFDCTLSKQGKLSFETTKNNHEKWEKHRAELPGFADPKHTYRHQGGGDINLYKAFLEQAHTLLRDNGRMGFIVPSGVYSDFGTIDLRKLFIEHCQWEWLFGFENREGIFDIHRSFKFNPVIIQKGGETLAIRTAFMRRELSNWEHGEDFVTDYPRAQVKQFSPKSMAILEIQSARDLEILEKIYSNSVLLGDQGPDGWGIKYATEFHMTNDSKLFPPRPKWEEWGYQPDEYSRWIKGPWRPIAELWQELGVNPDMPLPIDPECQRAITEGLRSGEVANTGTVGNGDINHGDTESTEGLEAHNQHQSSSADSVPLWSKTGGQPHRLRIAQPPYDRLPIPRSNIPEGIILSRHADLFIHEDDIPIVTFTEANGKPLKIKSGRGKDRREQEVRGKAIALPLYQGVMIYDLHPNISEYLFGGGHQAKWQRYEEVSSVINPQFMLAARIFQHQHHSWKICFRALARATDTRTIIPAVIDNSPCGNSLGLLLLKGGIRDHLYGCGISASLVYDWTLRKRIVGTNVNSFFLWETSWPSITEMEQNCFVSPVASLTSFGTRFSLHHLHRGNVTKMLRMSWAITGGERLRARSITNAMAAILQGLDERDFVRIIDGCDLPLELVNDKEWNNLLGATGFWRVDKTKHPEHRLTVLSLVAFHDLMQHVERCGGDREPGIAAFMAQNDGEGWMLPETLRLADYSLGHDDRAKEHQPVRECFGPRFYDWQLAQSAEESWRECHLHARNLLGKEGYQQLLDELDGKPSTKQEDPPLVDKQGQSKMFTPEDTGATPLFDNTNNTGDNS